jgi:DNA-binding CsgD family transcriptional regulator
VPLTARLEHAFGARLDGLPAPARDALLVAAVDDSDELREILAGSAALTGQPADIAAIETAAAADLVRLDELRLRFRHPLVRAAILQRETPARRRAASAALAAVLDGEPYRRIWHRAQSISGPDDTVAAELAAAHLIPLRRGSISEAIEALDRAAQLTTDPAARGHRLMLAAEQAFGLGRADLVGQLLSQVDRTALSRLDQARLEWLTEIFDDGVPGDAGRVLALCESAAEAIGAFEELCRLFDPADPAFHQAKRFHGVMFLAEAAARAGRAAQAREILAGLDAVAAVTPAPALHRQLSYARAVLADDDAADGLFRDALAADLTRWPWLRARLELGYGQWLRRQRRTATARPPLRSALATFDLIGAASWAEQARAELRAAGVAHQAEAAAPSGPAVPATAPAVAALSELSAQELQIARLAAEGLSNREIGERLYMSHRTVGSHLYRIFPKLGITSRAQLAAKLRSLPCALG